MSGPTSATSWGFTLKEASGCAGMANTGTAVSSCVESGTAVAGSRLGMRDPENHKPVGTTVSNIAEAIASSRMPQVPQGGRRGGSRRLSGLPVQPGHFGKSPRNTTRSWRRRSGLRTTTDRRALPVASSRASWTVWVVRAGPSPDRTSPAIARTAIEDLLLDPILQNIGAPAKTPRRSRTRPCRAHRAHAQRLRTARPAADARAAPGPRAPAAGSPVRRRRRAAFAPCASQQRPVGKKNNLGGMTDPRAADRPRSRRGGARLPPLRWDGRERHRPGVRRSIRQLVVSR